MVFKDKHDKIFYSSTYIFTYTLTYSPRHTLLYKALTNIVLKNFNFFEVIFLVNFLNNLAIVNAMFLITTL